MTANFDVDNADNWVQVYNGSFAATYIDGKATKVYTPIPATVLPVDIDSPLVAIYATSTDYPDSRKYLGSVIQGIISSGNLPTTNVVGRGKGIYSNQTTLARFTEYDDVYRLLLNPKFYVEQIDITVFKYIGSEFFELENRLNIIEQKIDQLL